jgi:hypothetical protein
MLRRLIHQKLEELKAGDLHTQHGLNESCYFKLLHQDDIYESFIKVVGEIWMDIENTREEASGCFEETRPPLEFYIRALELSNDFIRNEIELHQQHCNDDVEPDDQCREDKKGGDGKKHDGKKGSVPVRTSPRPKKVRGISTKKHEHGKKKAKSELVDRQRAKFDLEKARVMSSLPPEATKDFRQIFFASWEGQMMPVMQLGPYDLGPGKLRNDWFKMFQNVSKFFPYTRVL